MRTKWRNQTTRMTEDKKLNAAESPALPGPMVGNDPYKNSGQGPAGNSGSQTPGDN